MQLNIYHDIEYCCWIAKNILGCVTNGQISPIANRYVAAINMEHMFKPICESWTEGQHWWSDG
jgi:hypothetical protein